MLHYYTILHQLMQNLSRMVPVASFIVSSCSLKFQIGILYPWHEKMSKQISNLDKTVKALQIDMKKND